MLKNISLTIIIVLFHIWQSYGQTSSMNYVQTKTLLKSGVTNAAQLAATAATDLRQEITYFDGLGRPLQQIGIQASPDGKDIITPITYDGYGRQDKSYLPYAASGTAGSYRATAVADQLSFYATSPASSIPVIPTPYSQTVFEASPLDRPTEQGFPGSTTTWGVGGGHTVMPTYEINVASEVRLWNVTLDATTGLPTGATGTGYYDAGQLYRNVTKDENGNRVMEYKDKDGRVVCKKVQDGVSGTTPTYVTTQYVYDDFGDLTYVLPSNAESLTTITENNTDFNKFLYAYHYDGRRRLIEKKVPGKGWEWYVYNALGRMVMSQDAIQRAAGYWVYTKYDKFGRPVVTGTYNYGFSRSDVQALIPTDPSTLPSDAVLWEVRSDGTATGYTNLSQPGAVSSTYYTINYYDDYSFLSVSGVNSYPTLIMAPTGTDNESLQTNSLPTGTRTMELGGTKLRLSVVYYDKLGRVSKTATEHVLNGVDVTTNTYNFVGELTASTRKHYANNNTTAASPNLTLATTNTYDHWGRLSTVQKQVNSGTLTTVSTNTCNPVGQLQTKVLGKDATVTGGLQTINYIYNSRGWLSAMNAPLFSEKLWYEQSYNGSTAQWNGNISAQQWGWGTSGSYTNSYVYAYDKMNRLTAATNSEGSSNGYNETGITYDKVGNILTLTRPKVSATPISYNYTSSVGSSYLTSTTGGYTRTYAYNGNGSMTTDGQVNVTYNELNLPSLVKSVSGTTVNSQYIYDASGAKLKKITATETRYYVNGIEYYTNSTTTTPTIDIIAMEEGVIRNNSGVYGYEYFLKDHLGNMRVAFNKNSSNVAAQLQRYDYYAFGKEIVYNSSTTNKYLYNGKELQSETGQYDYGARFYDPNIGRWMVVDPLADFISHESTYNYAINNPIKMIDSDGRFSTHTDSSGNVLAVYNDGDLGVYKHNDATTKADVDKDRKATKTTAGNGQKMGETEYWDEFLLPGTNIPAGKIEFDKSWRDEIENLHKEAMKMDLKDIGDNSKLHKAFDLKNIKKQAPYGPMTGKLLRGKYATARSAGNYLAGYNGSLGTYFGMGISYSTYMKLAGALQLGEYNKFNAFRIVSFGTSFGPAPWYGEIEYTGRMVKLGWDNKNNNL